jgi:ankyrin repeat protein
VSFPQRKCHSREGGNPENMKCYDKNNDGWAPLHWAIENGHKEAIQILLGCKDNIKGSVIPANAGIQKI